MTYKIEYNEPSEFAIDFTIKDDDNRDVCDVYGNDKQDLNIECLHDDIEFGDDDECGVCPMCGATCMWHWETDLEDDRDEYGNHICHEYEIRYITDWSKPMVKKSIIEEVLDGYKD